MNALVQVDDRWHGLHGIGRYAREVTSRLTVEWASLGISGNPSNALDFLRAVPSNALVYSPGYNAFPRASRQILTIHDLIHLRAAWPGRAKYLLYYEGLVRPVVHRAGVVLTISETSRDAVREWLNDDTVTVVNAGNGCSNVFSAGGTRLDSEPSYLLYVGNLRAHKNLDVVLQALTHVAGIRLKALLPQAELREAARRLGVLGLSERVDLISGVSDEGLATLYRGAVATVMPSILEGFGLPPLESIQCGTPVAYWAGCRAVAETVGDRGFPVESARDVHEWAETIRLAMSQNRRVQPHRAGSYDWSSTAMNISQVLKAAIQNGP